MLEENGDCECDDGEGAIADDCENCDIDSEIISECDFLSGNQTVNFNGDDAIGLAYNGILTDQVGDEGDDPGNGWSVAGTTDATKDHTLVRKSDIVLGNTDWASSAGTSAEDPGNQAAGPGRAAPGHGQCPPCPREHLAIIYC